MKKYRIAKPKNGSKLGMLQQRICVLFWMDLTPVTYTEFYFNLIKNEEYDMDNFLKRFALLICCLIGGALMFNLIAWLLPIVGEWFKSLDVDNKWIYLSVALFIGGAAMAIYHVEKRKDKDWLTREEGESLGYYKDED